jgi:preprotein translocase subunit YajC
MEFVGFLLPIVVVVVVANWIGSIQQEERDDQRKKSIRRVAKQNF